MNTQKVVRNADENCGREGCCLAAVRGVMSNAEKLNASKAAQDVAERSKYVGVGAGPLYTEAQEKAREYNAQIKQGFADGGCSPAAQAKEQTKAYCASDAQPQDGPPFYAQRGTPLYWVVPAEIRNRIAELESRVYSLEQENKAALTLYQQTQATFGELKIKQTQFSAELGAMRTSFRAYRERFATMIQALSNAAAGRI